MPKSLAGLLQSFSIGVLMATSFSIAITGFIKAILKSLVILAICLALSGAI